jgi:hypothetical protein
MMLASGDGSLFLRQEREGRSGSFACRWEIEEGQSRRPQGWQTSRLWPFGTRGLNANLDAARQAMVLSFGVSAAKKRAGVCALGLTPARQDFG